METNARLANVAWEAMFRAQATLAREFEREGDWGDLLPREYGVLYALSTAPAGLRISDLGQDALLTQPGISRLVGRLEKRGSWSAPTTRRTPAPAGSGSVPRVSRSSAASAGRTPAR
jgi:DNA-binding MarR family transcriptional regulator